MGAIAIVIDNNSLADLPDGSPRVIAQTPPFTTLPVGTELFSAQQVLAQSEVAHANMVVALAKPGDQIAAELTAADAHSVHMVLGITGEAGELLDAVKKAVIYRKPLDRANVVEELGDIEFYLQGLRHGLGITREETLQANIAKLAKRYEQFKYSDQAAQNRADKAEGT